MANKLKIYLFLLICVYSLNSKGQSGQTNYTVNGKVFNIDDVNRQVEFVMKEAGVPGLSMAIIDKGKIVFYNTYGYRDLHAEKVKKVNERTKFQAASLSKSFIVFAAYKLIDQGLMNLDSPLYKYMDYDLLRHDVRYKLITARMILGHSSGIENHIEQNTKDKLEIIGNPGDSFIYSGEGYAYLAKVIESITNMPLERFMKENVYRPLKLQQTYTTSTGRANINHAAAHDQFGRHIERWKNKEPFIMSHIHTNACDYARLLIGTFNGRDISEQSRRNILIPEVKVNEKVYYGPGFELYFNQSDTIVFQGGQARGFKAMGLYSTRSNSGFVYFANSERSEKIGNFLCKLTTGIDASPFFLGIYENSYPSKANDVFKSYRKGGEAAAREVIDKYLVPEIQNGFTVNDMVELVYYFKDENYTMAKYIATEYFKRCPDCDGKVVFGNWLKR